jgi:hypothetical protein
MIDTYLTDTECFPNLWCIGFKRITDGKTLVLRKTEDHELNIPKLRKLIVKHCNVGYNWLGYDRAMIWAAIEGLDLAGLKQLNDRIILGGVRWWEVQDVVKEFCPTFEGFPYTNCIDLIEPQPNPFASLKLLNGRLHGRLLQDLPYSPDTVLTATEIEHVVSYMGNDLDATGLVHDALAEPLALRVAMGKEFDTDFRSKSDSQMGEAIVKKRYEAITKRRIKRAEPKSGTAFKYEVPEYIKFETPMLQDIRDKIAEHIFFVKPNYKVDMPPFLKKLQIPLGHSIYTMGLGGLHSTESNRSVFEDAENELVDADVASQYPTLILNLGKFPAALGPDALVAYRALKDERLIAKRAKDLAKDAGLKIALNGGFFGKTGSPFSALFAPHLLIAVTLTGQLTLLMLAERAEAAGIPVVSGNTDGLLFHCPRTRRDDLAAICKQWESEVNCELEFANYRSIHNQSVNTYIAIKADGTTKRKGTLMNPRKQGLRDQLMHNPGCDVSSDAVVEWLLNGTPVEDTIYAAQDMRDFVTVTNVKGGGTWRGEYLGKVVRYYWGIGGEPILYKDPHPTTGNFKKVSKSDGAIPCMTMPDELPSDLDYERYIDEAYSIIADFGMGKTIDPPVTFVQARINLMVNLVNL